MDESSSYLQVPAVSQGHDQQDATSSGRQATAQARGRRWREGGGEKARGREGGRGASHGDAGRHGPTRNNHASCDLHGLEGPWQPQRADDLVVHPELHLNTTTTTHHPADRQAGRQHISASQRGNGSHRPRPRRVWSTAAAVIPAAVTTNDGCCCSAAAAAPQPASVPVCVSVVVAVVVVLPTCWSFHSTA